MALNIPLRLLIYKAVKRYVWLGRYCSVVLCR